MSERVSVIFSMDDVALSPGQNAIARGQTGEWAILSRNGSRQLIDAICDPAKIEPIRVFLAPFNPLIIGVWRLDGSYYDTVSYPFDRAEYLALLPDVITYDEEGNELSRTPRTEPVMLHQWGGWGEKTFA